jgi:hypothetical protein
MREKFPFDACAWGPSAHQRTLNRAGRRLETGLLHAGCADPQLKIRVQAGQKQLVCSGFQLPTDTEQPAKANRPPPTARHLSPKNRKENKKREYDDGLRNGGQINDDPKERTEKYLS